LASFADADAAELAKKAAKQGSLAFQMGLKQAKGTGWWGGEAGGGDEDRAKGGRKLGPRDPSKQVRNPKP
jgi:hypothetical protein